MATKDDILNVASKASTLSGSGTRPLNTVTNQGKAVTAAGNAATNVVNAATPQFNGYQSMLDYLKTPMTKEQREANEKKEKRDKTLAAIGDGISALSNLYFAGKGAPNSFNPDKSMTAQTQARWDKINKENDDASKEYANWFYRMQRDKIGDDMSNRRQNFTESQAAQQQQNWQKQYDASQAAQEQQQKNWQAQFDASQEAQKFNQGMQERQQDFNEKNANRNYNLKVQNAEKGTYQEYSLGNGEIVRIPNSRNNAVNIGRVVNKIYELYPETKGTIGKPVVKDGEVVTDANGFPVVNEPSTDEMLTLVGKYTNDARIQKELRDLGIEVKSNGNTPPSRRSGSRSNSNTPPSRR